MTKRVDNTVSDTLHFFYDAQSKPAFVKWNNVMYRYVHSLQGDIVGILDANGNLVVEYKYDAWGKPLSTTGTLKTTLGELNPFRYRGYVWDERIELYYLRNRYYNPSLGRFINADDVITIAHEPLWHNTYCHCLGMPIISKDIDGKFAICALLVGTLAAQIVETLAVAVVYTAAVVLTAIVVDEITDMVVEGATDIQYAKEKKSQKTSKKSGKEKASDKPSWANPGMVNSTKTPQQNAENMLNNKYGPGNWKKGPGTEYNKIIKWIVRSELANAVSKRPTPRQLEQSKIM